MRTNQIVRENELGYGRVWQPIGLLDCKSARASARALDVTREATNQVAVFQTNQCLIWEGDISPNNELSVGTGLSLGRIPVSDLNAHALAN